MTPKSPSDDHEAELQETLDEALDELHELVEENPQGALELWDALPEDLRHHPEVLLGRARAVFSIGGAAAARDALLELVAAEPDFAEAHHTLALIYEELDDQKAMIEHFLEVYDLDQDNDDAVHWVDDAARDTLVRQVANVVESLPAPFRERLTHVPIVLEDRPGRHLVEGGFNPRAYGLFEGVDQLGTENQDVVDRVTRIVLFAANLMADFTGDELPEQVRITVLHECGHFFGLDEDDMERLGLD